MLNAFTASIMVYYTESRSMNVSNHSLITICSFKANNINSDVERLYFNAVAVILLGKAMLGIAASLAVPPRARQLAYNVAT